MALYKALSWMRARRREAIVIRQASFGGCRVAGPVYRPGIGALSTYENGIGVRTLPTAPLRCAVGYSLSPLRGCALFIVLASLVFTPTPLARADAPAPPATLPAAAPAGIDAGLWARMKAIDQTAARIEDLTADFEQRKFTPLLKKPLVSTGAVWAKGSAMLWDTRAPEPTVMRVDESQVTLYYPKQKTVEIYPLGREMGELAASPVPRLAQLLQHFTFAPASPRDLGEKDEAKSGADHEAFRLTPTDAAIRDHVDHVNVLIDAKRGFILAFKLVDADGETTEIRFSNVRTNSKVDDARLRLDLPAGVKTVRPLENLGGRP